MPATAMLGVPETIVFFRMPVVRPPSATPLIWFAFTIPVPVGPKLAPLPTSIAAAVLVPPVMAANAAELAIADRTPPLQVVVVPSHLTTPRAALLPTDRLTAEKVGAVWKVGTPDPETGPAKTVFCATLA